MENEQPRLLLVNLENQMPKGRSGRPWNRIKKQIYARRAPCCRCGQPIDYTLPYRGINGRPNPESKSIDHYPHPLATHPWLAEDPTNLAPAHLRCNQTVSSRNTPLAGVSSERW